MVWDGFIAVYLFLAGLGAGAFALGVLTNGAKRPVARMKRIAFIIAPIAVAVGTLVLVFDAKAGFNDPLRFFLLISNVNSVMSWGTVILSVFLLVSIVDLVILLVKKSTPKALDIAGLVLAVCVAAYTGVLLGDAGIAFPLWNMAVLPVLFVVSAASAGIAAVLFATRLAAPDEAEALPILPRAGLVLPVAELLLVAALLAATGTVSGSAASAAAASVANLLTGAYAVPFWLGLVVIGLVLPFVVELVRRRQAGGRKDREYAVSAAGAGSSAAGGSAAVASDAADSGRSLALVGEAGALVGGFMLRYLVIMAAVAVAMA